MMRHKPFLLIMLAILVVSIAGQANAERLYKRVAQGNNIGLGIFDDWGGPIYWADWATTCQFPRGSGNFIQNRGCMMPPSTIRDLNGDGLPEDTADTGDNGRAFMPYYSSIWAEETLTALVGGSVNMETASSSRSGTDINQVWSSLDVDNLATWPLEAREGYSPTGFPVTKGAETIFSHYGDAFNSWCENVGFYMGISFYFPDFGEANNMVFVHNILHQVTHYVKWRPSNLAKYEANPDGWTWDEMVMRFNQNGFLYGSTNWNWAFHPAREITVLWAPGTISSFTPPEPPIMAYRLITKPKFKGQEMVLSNFWTADRGSGGGFGYAGGAVMNELADPVRYRAIKAEYPEGFQGTISPFTGKGDMRGWPGLLSPDEPRFNQWLWGGKTAQQNTCYSSLKGMEPRDTTSFDYVMMFVPAEGSMINPPPLDIANIDDQFMQDAFARVLDYDDVAQAVYDIDLAGPETPRPPDLTIVPGDREVTITWSDVNVKTPDNFYYILEANGWNPDGYYREYDFEGYRVYRSYVGPNDSHSELLGDFNMTDGNLQFYYIDRLEDDYTYNRMRNGMKVWYALVPYDKNYNQTTGEEYSLPLETSGKAWNRTGTENAYNVIPRSDASNFKPMEFESFTFNPRFSTAIQPGTSGTATLTGDGSGKLTQGPVYLAPALIEFEVLPIIAEKVTNDVTVTVAVTETGWNEPNCSKAGAWSKLSAQQGSEQGPISKALQGQGDETQNVSVMGPVASDGLGYSVSMTFDNVKYSRSAGGDSRLYYQADVGGWTGGTVALVLGGCGGRDPGGLPAAACYTINSQFKVTWKDAGNGEMTVEVVNLTHNIPVPYTEYFDDLDGTGWGFWTQEGYGGEIGAGDWNNGTYAKEWRAGTPRDERTVTQAQTIAADNTEHFALWINGLPWRVDIDGYMPPAGTVWTITNAYGRWNSDQTRFTQYPDMPWTGDSWTIQIKGTTMNPEDADLSKIRVVPNPYIATSYLDLSPINRRIEFVNLPDRCTIRIYTLGGNLVNVLNHIGANRQGWGNYTDWDRLVDSQPKVFTGYDNHSGTEPWNLRNRFGATVASGLYFFHVTDTTGRTYIGKFYVVL